MLIFYEFTFFYPLTGIPASKKTKSGAKVLFRPFKTLFQIQLPRKKVSCSQKACRPAQQINEQDNEQKAVYDHKRRRPISHALNEFGHSAVFDQVRTPASRDDHSNRHNDLHHNIQTNVNQNRTQQLLLAK